MTTISKEELQQLLTQRKGHCISIFMPSIEKSQEVRQNAIRFKNLINQAEQLLLQAGMEQKEADAFLAPAVDLLDDGMFWQHQSSGLAVFIAKDFFQTHALRMEPEENVTLADRFTIKPLLPMLREDEEFYILTVSQNQVHMFRATQQEVEPVEVPNMPKSLVEAEGEDVSDNNVSFHTSTAEPGSRHGGGERPAIFYGYGQGEEDRDKRLVNFFHKVDKAVSAYLRNDTAPLLLAGVEYHLPLYKEANTYAHLADDIIAGNHDETDPDTLREEAWQKLAPIFHDNRGQVAEQYKMLAGRKDQRAVKDLKEVVKAAPYGRVEVLFVDKNAKQWGTFDETNIVVKLDNEHKPGNQDLLDFAVAQTLMNGGTVYAVDPDELPEGNTPVAAIFRY